MNKYIIVLTYCDNIKLANQIIENLLNKKLVAGSQLTEVNSKYWWNNKIVSSIEYKLEFRTKESLFDKVKNEILKIHNYEVSEISYLEIKGANQEICNWIEENVIKKESVKDGRIN